MNKPLEPLEPLDCSIKNIHNDVRQKIIIIIIFDHKIPIRLTSVGLAHARPNYVYHELIDVVELVHYI